MSLPARPVRVHGLPPWETVGITAKDAKGQKISHMCCPNHAFAPGLANRSTPTAPLLSVPPVVGLPLGLPAIAHATFRIPPHERLCPPPLGLTAPALPVCAPPSHRYTVVGTIHLTLPDSPRSLPYASDVCLSIAHGRHTATALPGAVTPSKTTSIASPQIQNSDAHDAL